MQSGPTLRKRAIFDKQDGRSVIIALDHGWDHKFCGHCKGVCEGTGRWQGEASGARRFIPMIVRPSGWWRVISLWGSLITFYTVFRVVLYPREE